jgi:hypothetical protein
VLVDPDRLREALGDEAADRILNTPGIMPMVGRPSDSKPPSGSDDSEEKLDPDDGDEPPKEPPPPVGATPTENRLPTNEAQVKHIFRQKTGHISDTPNNLQLLEDVANDPKNVLGPPDKHGVIWSARTLPDGTQVWVRTRNGVIMNGGINSTPKTYNPQSGLSSPQRPTGGRK